jgi:hypothetical protein
VQISPFLSICICRKFESAFTCSKCLFPEWQIFLTHKKIGKKLKKNTQRQSLLRSWT